MARYVSVKATAHTSRDSFGPWATGADSPGFGTLPTGVDSQSQAADEELLDLWDDIWFGVSGSPDVYPQHRVSKLLVDPLEGVPIAVESLDLLKPQLNAVPGRQQVLYAAEPQLPTSQLYSTGFNSMQAASKSLSLQQQLPVAAEVAKLKQPPTPDAADHHLLVSSGSGEGQPAPNSGVSVPRQQQSPQRQCIPQTAGSQHQEDPARAPYVLGTWAQRRYVMPVSQVPQKEQGVEQGTAAGSLAKFIPSASTRWQAGSTSAETAEGSGSGSRSAATENIAQGAHASAVTAAESEAAAVNAANADRACPGTDEDDDEAVMQAAWRWRFTKRWQAEQTRVPLEPTASVGDGGMEEALQYLAACGENNWHISRATSGEAGCTAESRMLGTLGTPSLLTAELLVDEGSFSAHGSSRGGLLQSTESGGFLSREASHSGGAGRGEATRQVSGITKRAAQLLAAQSDINKKVTQRWREVQSAQASELWVGALLESVEVDDWGKYKFLLLRIRDRAGRQKLLVRGANYASDAKLVEGLHRQMMAVSAAHDVPAETLEIVGGGVMEWRRHRDRHLHISGGYVSPASGPGGPSTAPEVMNLAAVLTKQHLPMHYKVTSDGGKAM